MMIIGSPPLPPPPPRPISHIHRTIALLVQRHALGSHLYALVVKRFQLPEPEYFDIEFHTSDGKQVLPSCTSFLFSIFFSKVHAVDLFLCLFIAHVTLI